ncbi:hypothetical protein NDA13_006199 [Ustilago tritici]|nr:hypothetical protein NDA13_006199 [Ustilago tritici]
MDSTDTTQAVEDVSRDKTHATTPSFGSSMLSFHTVQSSTDTPRKTLLHLEESFDVEELIDEGHATPQQTIDLKEDKSIEDVSTPTPTSSAFDTQTPNTGLPDLECEDGHSGDSEEEEEEKVLGHAIKSLPNGMTSLPSPSVGSRSFDCSSSPFSRPLALVSLAPTEESRRRSLRPIVYTPPTTTNTVAADSSSSGDSASSTNPTRPSTPSSATTTHPTASPHHTHTRKKKDKEIESEWGAQFWTLITDPCNPRNTFFANPATGECKWELPKGTIVLPPRDEGEWWELYDEERKGEYYWHTKTEECRWDRPGEGEGFLVPMRKVQARHFIPCAKGGKRRSVSEAMPATQGRIGRVGVEREEEKEIVTTPLRPRTKSLPRNHHHRQHEKQDRRATRNAAAAHTERKEKKEEDLALQARRSIVLRDQRALAIARETSTPPFRLECIPKTPKKEGKRKIRRSTTGSPIRPHFPTQASSRTYRFLFHPPGKECGLGLEDELSPISRDQREEGEDDLVVPIIRVGKGLAYHPNDASGCGRDSPSSSRRGGIRARKSLPFLTTGAGVENKVEDRKKLVELPEDLACALLNVNTDPALVRLEKERVGEEQGGEKGPTPPKAQRKEGKLTKLISWTTLSRCKRSASVGESG